MIARNASNASTETFVCYHLCNFAKAPNATGASYCSPLYSDSIRIEDRSRRIILWMRIGISLVTPTGFLCVCYCCFQSFHDDISFHVAHKTHSRTTRSITNVKVETGLREGKRKGHHSSRRDGYVDTQLCNCECVSYWHGGYVRSE